MATRIFIADDHAMVRVGLRQVLSAVPDFVVVGEAENGRRVLDARELATCDVLVLDLSLPVIAGSEVLHRVRTLHPHLAVVVHSMHPEPQFKRRALEAGAVAYVSKEAPPSDLVDAVRRAVSSPAPRASELPPEPARHATLSPREHQVFQLILAGRQVADIASELDVHSCTVSNHLARIRAKLGVTTTAGIVRYAYDEGIVAPALARAGDEDAG